jgi:hypothetical protein
VRTPITIRAMVLLLAGILLLALPQLVSAQEDANDAPLGDVARSFRKKTTPSPSELVIDNDNFSKVVEDAESRRKAGTTMVFSLDPGAKDFHVSSPDVSCSFSFSAKTSSLLSDPVMLDELPPGEIAKLEGPATIDGDSLQVSMHNGTSWDLREIVIGLTILRRPEVDAASSHNGARLVPAVASGPAPQSQDSFQKQPDVTVLLRVKGSAAPSATALFRTQLNFALFPDQEWHWAIVKAKGVPPKIPVEVTTTQPELFPGQPPALPSVALSPDASPQVPPTTPSTSSADVEAH